MHLAPASIGQVRGWLVAWILISINFLVHADSGQDFLTSIIARLKEEKPAENHQQFYNELMLKATSRSADEYQIHENEPEPVAAGNELLDFNHQNALQQFNLWPNEATNFGTGNDLHSQLVNFQSFPAANAPPVSTTFPHQPVIDQPIALANFPNFPSQQLQQQLQLHQHQQSSLDPALNSASNDFGDSQPLSLHDNRGPNLFSSTEDAFGAQQVVTPAYNLQVDHHANNGQPLTLPALMLNQGLNAIRNGPLQSAYNNYYNADHVVNDHLINNALNAMGPAVGEHLIVGPHKQFMVEPLFVAMAGFVGVAMIFMSAVLFLPKLLTPPPRVSSLKGPQEIAALTKLAVQTIEGNDCTERIACEVGRAMRSLHVSGKPIEVLEVLVSKNVANQLAQIRKALAKKQVCRLIQCKPLKSVGYSAAEKSKSAVEPKLPKIEFESVSSSAALKSDHKAKGKLAAKEKQSPPEPRIEVTTKHSVVKKTLKAEQAKEATTKRNPTTVILKLL